VATTKNAPSRVASTEYCQAGNLGYGTLNHIWYPIAFLNSVQRFPRQKYWMYYYKNTRVRKLLEENIENIIQFILNIAYRRYKYQPITNLKNSNSEENAALRRFNLIKYKIAKYIMWFVVNTVHVEKGFS